jgi:hypothetical protein
MRILFGILASLAGLVFAVFNKRFARANDASSKELFGRSGKTVSTGPCSPGSGS